VYPLKVCRQLQW